MTRRSRVQVTVIEEVWVPRSVAATLRRLVALYRAVAAQRDPWTMEQSVEWWGLYYGLPERWRGQVQPPPRDDEDTTAAQLRRRAAVLEREFLGAAT